MNDFPPIIKKEIGDGSVEFINIAVRPRCGFKTTELKISFPDGRRKIVVVRDLGFRVDVEEISINGFKTRIERNNEIRRLYEEENLSQIFLANIFNVSQPTISLVTNKKEGICNE